MKKYLFLFFIVITFVLTGCFDNSRLRSVVTKNEEKRKLDSLVFDILQAFKGEETLLYVEEDSFTTDSLNNNYEIGYVYDIGLKFELRNNDSSSNISLKEKVAFTYHKARRNIETKEFDKTYTDYLDDSKNCFQIYYSKNDKKYVKEICSTKTDNKSTIDLTEEMFYSSFPGDIHIVSYDNVRRIGDSSESYIYSYIIPDFGIISFDYDDAYITDVNNLYIVMPDGNKFIFLSVATEIKLDS